MRLLDLVYRHWFRCLAISLLAAVVLFVGAGEHWADALFHALQLIVLNYDYRFSAGDDYFWGVKTLQFAVPAFASVGLIKNLFYEQVGPLVIRAWTRFSPPEVLVVGGGAVGASIAENMAAQGMRVLIVDPCGAGNHATACGPAGQPAVRGERYRSPLWLRGDGRDRAILAGANASRAKKVFVCTGNDEINLQVARQLFAFFEACPKSVQPVSVRVQLLSDDARRAVRDWLGWYSLIGRHAADIEAFDIHEIAAREMFLLYSPDRFMPTDHEGAVSQLVVVSGASRMAQALIERAARLGHFSVRGRLRILWIDREVESVSRTLRASSPHIAWREPSDSQPGDGWTEVDVERSVEVIPLAHCLAEALHHDLIARLSGGRMPAVFWACHEDSARNAAEVRDYCAFHNRTPAAAGQAARAVAVQFSQTLGLSQAAADLALFTGLSCTPQEASIMDFAVETLCNEQRDNLAKYINTVIYNKGDYATEAALQWAGLPEFIRESNRDAADHTYVKLRYCGVDPAEVDRHLAMPLALITASSIAPPDPCALEQRVIHALKQSLSVVEHRRYCAFMFAAGFALPHAVPHDFSKLPGLLDLAANRIFGVDQVRKQWERTVRVNPTLLAFDTLSEREKHKDDAIVDHMFKLARPKCDLRRARKRRLPVQVRFASGAGEVETLEGMVSYEAASAIVTGSAGEQWPVERSRFEDSYEPVAESRMGQAGEYISRQKFVTAIALPAPCTFTLSSGRGRLAGRQGDWLVQYDSGDIGVVARDIFASTYELCA